LLLLFFSQTPVNIGKEGSPSELPGHSCFWW